jgi:Flp pilus assembly pilin Flp
MEKAKDLCKRFICEEDGMGTVEIVIIIAVLVSVALIFKDGITDFVKKMVAKVFQSDSIADPYAGHEK